MGCGIEGEGLRNARPTASDVLDAAEVVLLQLLPAPDLLPVREAAAVLPCLKTCSTLKVFPHLFASCLHALPHCLRARLLAMWCCRQS